MSALTITRTAQGPLSAKFVWSYADTMYDTLGVSYSLGADTSSDIIAAAKIFTVIKLPVNSIVTGGFISATTTFDTAGYDAIVGDSGSAARYLASTDIKTAGTTQLVPTGYLNTGGLDITLSLATDDACTAGAGILVVEYIISDRVTEVI